MALERIAQEEARPKVSPLVAFASAAVRVRLVPDGLDKEGSKRHDLLVEYSDLATKKSEHVHHEMVTLPQQVRVGLVGEALVVSYREGDGNWRALFTRNLTAVTEDRFPIAEFDWR